MLNARNIVFEEFLRFNASEPVHVRIRNYRALADIIGEDNNCRQLLNIAAGLESADARCREFAFQFSQRKEGGQ